MPLPPTRVFVIVVPQRRHGRPSRPYTRNSSCIAPREPSGVRYSDSVDPWRSDPRPKRRSDRALQSSDFVRVEVLCREQWTYTRAPQRLVGVDVPQAGDDPLVEENRLHRSPAHGQARAPATLL